jgi:hypothetical protein
LSKTFSIELSGAYFCIKNKNYTPRSKGNYVTCRLSEDRYKLREHVKEKDEDSIPKTDLIYNQGDKEFERTY